MCGRFTITLDPGELQDELDLGDFPADFAARYNVAPTQPVAVTRDAAIRAVEWMRWGLIPFWAKDMTIGVRMINAKSETLVEKPSFRDAFAKRRCLIPADGFYEWQKSAAKGPSIPHYYRMADGKPFFFAGLWDTWKDSEGKPLNSCTIITCSANKLVGQIHERMPVIFNAASAWDWLKPAAIPDLQKMLLPYPAEKMNEYVVSTAVNSPALDGAELVRLAE